MTFANCKGIIDVGDNMSKQEFIRLNVNDNYLSLGNFIRVIKEEAENANSFWQSELFCIIFNTEDIADSTVNNYCTGLRAINIKYKNYFKEVKNEFERDRNCLITTIGKILVLIENKSVEYTNININYINSNDKLKKICNRLYSISKNDSDVSVWLANKLYKYIEKNDLYNFLIQVMFYIILEKKQPIYISKKINDVIEKNIYDTNISINDIHEYINIQLNSGIWSIRGIKELVKKKNPFACFEIASMEFYGIITGIPRYNEAYKYYKIAAEYSHPVANWAIGYMYYEGYIGNKTRRDILLAFKYFNKARKLKCSNAFNSIGIMMLKGDLSHIGVNKNKAIDMFKQAVSMGNVYAYNNLGKMYEDEKKYKDAYNCYIVSANLGESWAANKIGEFYRNGIGVKKDLKKAYDFYLISSDSSRFTICSWSKYNLAKYFYEYGNLEAKVDKNLNKAIELLETISDDLFEAKKELLYIYYTLYVQSKKKNSYYLKKINEYKEQCECSLKYNQKIKKEVEDHLKQINGLEGKITIP